MRVTVIGCGNAFSFENGNQSFMLEENGKKLLIDAGTRIPLQLRKFGIPLKEIDAIYVSHQHADHIGGLEEIAFSRYDWINKPRHYNRWPGEAYAPKLYGNVHLLEELWEQSLKGGLKSMEGFDATLETFFEVHPIEPNDSFTWEGWNFQLIQQIHVMTGSMIMPTFGLIVRKESVLDPERKSPVIYFTTDSQHCSPRQSEIFYKEADIIFQDCECAGVDMSHKEGEEILVEENEDTTVAVPHQRFKFGSGVHANYAQLAGYPSANSVVLSPQIKAKMWLSHYQDFVLEGKDFYGNPCDWAKEAKEDGFAGFVEVGQEFTFE
jgi:ribonuclease BN (tRNA processing enzyme)